MGAQLRLVGRRIRTVKPTAKITRAQELIASSRIIRAQQRLRAAEPYAREITRAVEAVVSRSSNIRHPLTTEPDSRTRAAVLILTSDRGFAGGEHPQVPCEAVGLRGPLGGGRSCTGTLLCRPVWSLCPPLPPGAPCGHEER